MLSLVRSSTDIGHDCVESMLIDNEFIILNDKTGEIKVNLSKIDSFNFKTDDLINILGDLELQTDGEKLLIADIIQDMNKLNFSYYQKLYQIKKDLM